MKAEDRTRKADERTVDTLQRLYAMIIALALTTGVKLLIETLGIVSVNEIIGQSPDSPKRSIILVFIAFLSTLIAFYHGMNRHLDETYILGLRPDGRRLPLMIDIVVFVVESGLLYVMASTINRPQYFLISWSVLLGIDILWSIVVFLIQRQKAPVWAVNNVICLSTAWVCWEGLFPQNAISITAVEIIRSLTDYYFYWSYYFPKISIGRLPRRRPRLRRYVRHKLVRYRTK